MTAYNLAVCFSPVLFSVNDLTIDEMSNIDKLVWVLEEIISNPIDLNIEGEQLEHSKSKTHMRKNAQEKVIRKTQLLKVLDGKSIIEDLENIENIESEETLPDEENDYNELMNETLKKSK